MTLSKKTNVTSTKKQKINFISAVLIVIGSSIGAGIFLKNGEILGNTQGNIWMAMIAWIIAIFAIICLGLCLTELCSASSKNKLGIIGWIKIFCNEYLYQSGKKFMAYLYLPINFFIMPFYAVMTMQEAFPNSAFAQLDWYYIALISLAISMWFIFTSGLSSKMTNIQNWIITSVKFLPLIFAAIIGYVYVGDTHSINESVAVETSTPLFNQLNPVLGIFISIPSIFFVFDGFYSTAGLQTEMKEPKKTSNAMLIGLLCVSTIDLLISISLMISGQGSLSGLTSWFESKNCLWVLQTMQMIVAFGIFGIINGFCLYSSNFYEDLVANNDIVLAKFFQKKLNPNTHTIGCLYSFVLFFVLFWVCTLIGGLGYIDTNSYGSLLIGYTPATCKLYSFVDLMANWTSVLAFACIVAGIAGALKNKKTKKVKTCDDKNFNWASWITIIIVGYSLVMIVIQTFANLGLVVYYAGHNMYDNLNVQTEALVGTIMTVVVLFLFLGVMFVPTSKTKYNLVKYEN